MTAELASFKTSIHDKVAVQVNQTTRLDIVMQVGEVSQTVQVEAEEPLLLSNTSELGTVVSQQQFQELPLIGQGETRNPTFFMILVPGVTGRGRQLSMHWIRYARAFHHCERQPVGQH